MKSNKTTHSIAKFITLALLLISLGSITKAQEIEYTSIKKIRLQATQPIMEKNVVKGYFTFFYLEKANKKENVYQLDILSDNMDVINSVEMVKSSDYQLMESSYNGENFCLAFINFTKKVAEYMILNGKGEKVATYKTPKLSNSELSYLQSIMATEEDVFSGGVIAMPTRGFARFGMEKGDGWRYLIEMIDNTGKKIWENNSGNTDKKAFESAAPIYADSKVLIALCSTRERLLSSKGKSYILFIDAETGKELFQTEPNSEDNKHIFQPIGVNSDEETNEYFIYGEYYNKGDNLAKDKSEGFYFQKLNGDGKVVQESFASWKNEISKALPINSRGKMADNMSVVIHNMVRTADGRVFAIGEQFKKSVSASGIALNLLSNMSQGGITTDAGYMKIEIHDIVIFEFDEKLKIKGAEIFEKKQSNSNLPKGYGTLSTPLLGLMMKSYGMFDYNFTIKSEDNMSFAVAYTNYDRSKEENSNYLVGYISYVDNKMKLDKVRLSKKPTAYAVMPAKEGHIAIIEYFRKKKTLTLRVQEVAK